MPFPSTSAFSCMDGLLTSVCLVLRKLVATFFGYSTVLLLGFAEKCRHSFLPTMLPQEPMRLGRSLLPRQLHYLILRAFVHCRRLSVVRSFAFASRRLGLEADI